MRGSDAFLDMNRHGLVRGAPSRFLACRTSRVLVGRPWPADYGRRMEGAAGQPNIANIFLAVKAKYGHASPLTCEKSIGAVFGVWKPDG